MSTTDWRQSTWGKFISVILTFALAFSFIPLSAYADEAEDNADVAAVTDAGEEAGGAASEAQPADEGPEGATSGSEAAEGTHPVAQIPAEEAAEAIDDKPGMQLTEDLALEYVGYASVDYIR